MQALYKLSGFGEMAGAFAESDEAKSLLRTNNIYSVSLRALRTLVVTAEKYVQTLPECHK